MPASRERKGWRRDWRQPAVSRRIEGRDVEGRTG